jgi:MFS family permease
MKKDRQDFARDLRLTLVVLACGAANAINIAKLAPAIEVIMADFSLSLSAVGLLASLFSILFVTAGILIGITIKAIGAKRALVASLMLALVGTAITLIFPVHEGLFIGRITEGIGLIAVLLSAPAILTQHTNPERRGIVMGIWGGFMPLGNALALFGAPLILTTSSWPAIWVAGFVFMSISLILCVVVIPPDRIQPPGQFDFDALKNTVQRRILLILGVLFALHSIVYQILLQFTPLIGKSIFGIPIFWASHVAVCFCLFHFIGNILTGHLLQRDWTARTIIFPGSAIMFAAMLVMSMTPDSPVIFGTALLVVGLVSGAAPPVCFYLLSHEKTDDIRNMPIFTSWMVQIMSFGMFLGPVVFAVIVEIQNSWIFGIGCFAFFYLGQAALSFALPSKNQP